jgi:hypothetical protein
MVFCPLLKAQITLTAHKHRNFVETKIKLKIMKKILFSALTLFAVSSGIAQSNFFTKTCYRGAFAPSPAAPWTDGWTEWDPQNKVYPAPTLTVSSDITSNTTWSAGQTILLQGPIYVTGNSVLTIDPGVVVRVAKNLGSALIVTRGSQLIANGTVAAPIVFTSDQAAGARAIGDWGGIILLGRASNNYTSGVNYVEGLPQNANTEFGSTSGFNDNDNSGSLKYLRIEFGGYQYQPNQEINGLTMGSVGRGTTIEHIQVSFVNDDAYEWFGGTVNAKWLVSYRNLDDDFDTDNGYSGNVQFGLIVRDPNIADNPAVSTSEGFESDNNAAGTALTPVTSAIFSNITMVGPYRGASTNTVAAGYRRGARIRRASNLKIYNSIFMDVQRGIHIDGTLCENAATAGNLVFKNNIVAGTAAGRVTEVNSGSTFNAPAWFGTSNNDSLVYSNPAFNSILTTPYNYTAPDYRPGAGSIALSGASFTDAALSAVTGVFTSTVLATIPSSFCLGSDPSAIQPASFVASSTVSPDYCSLSWSVSPGVAISNTLDVNPSFTISTLGTFSVYLMVTDANGTQAPVVMAVTTQTCLDVSVKEIRNYIGAVSLFPNPAKDAFTLSVNAQNAAALDVAVYDITGKLVASPVSNHALNSGENNLTINTEALHNGIYFVTLTTANGKETVKLVVNK